MGSMQVQLGCITVGDREDVAVMGIINLDPYSFYSPSYFASQKEAISATKRMIEEGADIIDVGGVSTAPGSPEVSVDTEKRRVATIIRQIAQNWDVPISIDTQRTQVVQTAIRYGATIVNDVSGLKHDPDMAKTIQDSGVSCVLMAAGNRPGDRATFHEIILALQESLQIALSAGIPSNHIVVDPGIGFGKPFECDLKILRNLRRLRVLEQPILLGLSRKHFIGKVLGYSSPQDRLYGTLAALTISLQKGVHVVRTHDIRATQDCVKMVNALMSIKESE
ncbi:MAG: dihydropteroate synthase [Candidatus Odinarchaeota archaeon]